MTLRYYEMTEIQKKQEDIEQKINEWLEEGRIIDVRRRQPTDGVTVYMRIQLSGPPISVYFNGQGCKVGLEDSNQPLNKFNWVKDDVIEKVIEYIDQLLNK
jgi:hypothetical protein